jgi:membrane protease YdiL (CAAX protease family)
MQDRKRLRAETLLVLGVSLGYSAVYSIVDIIGKLSASLPLSSQTTTLNPSRASGRPVLDLAFQLVEIVFGAVPALLAIHLLGNDPGEGRARLGLLPPRLRSDLGRGAALAACIGIPGLAFYLGARALGVNTTIVPEALPKLWWTVPVLLLSAFQNAFLEEIVVVGYLFERLRAMSWGMTAAIIASALLRGTYHIYQGFGGFAGNAAMGIVFAYFYARTKRVGPLIVAHALIDSIAFVGYAFVRGPWS